MQKDKKQKQQLIALAVVTVVIVGVVIGFYWRSLLPSPVSDGSGPAPSAARLPLGSGDYGPLLERQDFRNLETFGDVPVKAPPSAGGNPHPFVSSVQAGGKATK